MCNVGNAMQLCGDRFTAPGGSSKRRTLTL